MLFESLETRRLMSSSITTTFTGGALEVRGGSSGTFISVTENNGNVLVEDITAGTSQVFAGVTSIKIKCQAGTDKLYYTGNSIGASINGDGGNDFIVVSDLGTGSSSANGDGGDDDLTIMYANNTTIIGEGGGDKLYIQASVGVGETWIYGLGGSDIVTVEAGINHIDGGGGKDMLIDVSGGLAVNIVSSVETT